VDVMLFIIQRIESADRNWQGRMHAFFPGKKAAKKPADDAAWTRQQTICAWNLSVVKRASGHKKSQENSDKTSELVFRQFFWLFPVRFAHSRASFAGLPGSGERHFCFNLILLLLRR